MAPKSKSGGSSGAPAGAAAPLAAVTASFRDLTPSKFGGLVVANYADAAAVLIALMVLGYAWNLVGALWAPFVVFSHNVTAGEKGGQPGTFQYTYGPGDITSVFFFVLVVMVVQDIGREFVFEKIAKRLGVGKEDQVAYVLQGNYFVGLLTMVAVATSSLSTEKVLSSYSTLGARYPFVSIFTSSKAFAHLVVAYWLHLFVIMPIHKAKPAVAWPWKLAGLLNIAIMVAAVFLNLVPVAVLLYTIYNVGALLRTFAALIAPAASRHAPKGKTWFQSDGAGTYELVQRLTNAGIVVSKLAAVVVVAVSVHVLGLQLNEAAPFDAAQGNWNLLPVRCGLIAVLTLAVILPVWPKSEVQKAE